MYIKSDSNDDNMSISYSDLYAAAKDPLTSQRMLAQLAHCDNNRYAAYVAENSSASVDLIRSLYASALDGSYDDYTSGGVICAVAANPSTPEDIFYELAEQTKGNGELLSALKHNPSLPADLRRKLSRRRINMVSRIIVDFSGDPSGNEVYKVCTSVVEAAGYKIYDEWFDDDAEDEYRIYCEVVTSNCDADKIDTEIRHQLAQRGVTVNDIDWDVEESDDYDD